MQRSAARTHFGSPTFQRPQPSAAYNPQLILAASVPSIHEKPAPTCVADEVCEHPIMKIVLLASAAAALIIPESFVDVLAVNRCPPNETQLACASAYTSGALKYRMHESWPSTPSFTKSVQPDGHWALDLPSILIKKANSISERRIILRYVGKQSVTAQSATTQIPASGHPG